MAYNTKPIVTDKDGNPISQYFNPITDEYEEVTGANGANKVLIENNDLSLLPILDKLSQLTGTVIDEETRKSNEVTRQDNEQNRVQLYNDLLIELEKIEQIQEQVPETVLDSINALRNGIGDMQDLDTLEKSNLVLALNEVYQNLATHEEVKATQDTLGHVKAGNNITIDEDGTIHSVGGGEVPAELLEHPNKYGVDDVHNLLTDGKIIEEVGSNANGRYIRFSDGTQICSIYRVAIPDSGDTGFRQSTLTFPAEFYEAPSVVAMLSGGTTGITDNLRLLFATNATSSSVGIRAYGAFTNTWSMFVNYIAIGRWK